MDSKRRINWQPWLMAAGFIISLAIAIYFSYRAVRLIPRLHASTEIRPWMSIPYIAHAYRVPATDLYQALGIPYLPHDHRPLFQIARSLGVPVQTVISELYTAIQELRPPGSPTPPHAPPQNAQGIP